MYIFAGKRRVRGPHSAASRITEWPSSGDQGPDETRGGRRPGQRYGY